MENTEHVNPLQDVSNTQDAPEGEQAAEDAQALPESNHAEVREKGWTEPTPFNYEEYADRESHGWAGVAARYEWKLEWNDGYGDVGPRNEELEKQLFESDLIPRAGGRLKE